MMKKIVGILVFFLLIIYVQAIDVSGNQSGVWGLSDSPYTVTGDITVPAESTLEIEAGVEVIFAGDYQITAEGRIIAQGNESNMITFRANSETTSVTHQGIRLEYEGDESNIFEYCFFKNAENGINSINSPVTITNSHFTYNDEAIHIFAIGNLNPPTVHIEENLIENSVKSGILIAESSNVMIVNNEITGNGTGPQFRGAIQVSIQSDAASVTPTITENNIHNNHYQGITCVDIFSCGGINAQIFNNIISENYTGVYFYNCSGTLYDNEIINNHIDGDMNSGAGIMCYGSGATPYIAGNLISGNYGGIYLTVGAQPVIGAPEMNHPYAYGLNTIQDNIDVNGNNNSVILNNISSSISILAKNNFWGTTVTSEIDETITDSNDNSSLGTVIYLPLASEITDYTLTINLSSEIIEDVEYKLHVRDLATLEVTPYQVTSLDQPLVITFEAPLDITLFGSFEQDSQWQYGHCYYGPFDEPTIVSLNDNNTSQEIDITFNEAPRQKTFRTYPNVEVNGIDATPILKDEFHTDQVKQLIYENDNNELMLVGYQKYGVNGWETVTLEEDLLYLKNDAQVGETFTNHQVSFIDGQYIVYSNACEVVGSYLQEIQNNEVSTKVIHKILDSPWDMETTAMIEYTGNVSPLSVNPRTTYYSDYIATSNDFFGPFNQEKLLNFQQEVQVDYQTETSLLQPTNLRLLGETIYWNPCYYVDYGVPGANLVGYDIYIDSANNEDLEFYQVGLNQTSLLVSLLDLPAGESDIWVCGRNNDGENTSPSNAITINIVSNEVNDIVAVTSLDGNYPNPFNPETRISYNLKSAEHVIIDVYNIKGQKVKSLVNELKERGNHTVVWNGRDDSNNSVSSGLYFYKMKSGKYTSTKKMILLK